MLVAVAVVVTVVADDDDDCETDIVGVESWLEVASGELLAVDEFARLLVDETRLEDVVGASEVLDPWPAGIEPHPRSQRATDRATATLTAALP